MKAVRNTKTAAVINTLTELSTWFGLPKRIISDRGTAYTSKCFKDFCEQNDIQHIKTAVRTPRANGQVERANQTILSYLRTTVENDKTWDDHLGNLKWTVNSQKNSTTNFSPHELIFDFNLRDIVHNHMIAALQDNSCTTDIPIDKKREIALENIRKAREKWKTRFDNRHLSPKQYAVNELVLISHEPVSTGESRKLKEKFKGPYIIRKCLGNDRYLIEDIEGLKITNKPAVFIFSSDQLRPWCSTAPELEKISDDQDEEGAEDVSTAGKAELSAPIALSTH